MTGLTPGASYTFTVTAANASGTGPASAPSNAVVVQGPPAAPTAVIANAHDGHAVVAFAPPSSDGGSPVVYYTVTASPGGASANTTGTTIDVGGLTNGQAYTFTVTATNANGTSVPSDPSPPVTPRTLSRPHPDPPPSGAARPDIPAFVAPPGPRVPPPGH